MSTPTTAVKPKRPAAVRGGEPVHTAPAQAPKPPSNSTAAVEKPGPRQRDAVATRARLLDAAEAEFAAHGFAGTRVDEVARAAGTNVQLIYRYFGDKLGLHRAVFDRLFMQAAHSLVQALAALPPDMAPKERLARQIGAYFDFVWMHPTFANFSLWSLAEGIVPGFGGPGEGLQAMTRVAEQALGDAIASGVIRPDVNGEMLGGMLVSLCVGQFQCLRARSGSDADLDPLNPAVRARTRQLVVDALLGAFGAR